jgi:hypothetical protein
MPTVIKSLFLRGWKRSVVLIAALLATHKHPYVGVARMRLSLLTPAIVDMYASFWTNLVVLFRMTYWINKIKL